MVEPILTAVLAGLILFNVRETRRNSRLIQEIKAKVCPRDDGDG